MKNIVLASASPRRMELLKQIGLEPIVKETNITESLENIKTKEQFVMSMAFEKANSIKDEFLKSIIIAADTIVVLDDIILGKPNNTSDAFNMLQSLSGREHEVITGYCILDTENNLKYIDYEKTKVFFDDLSEEKIEKYISTGEPFDKAGGYGIQGLGALLVKRIEGCYNNVKGLPLKSLESNLNKYFNFNIL